MKHIAPNVSAESSIKIRLFLSAIPLNFFMFGTLPNNEGIINAFVLLVIACSICNIGSRFTSTNTGVNPFFMIGDKVVAKVSIGVIISESFGKSKIEC